MRTPEQGVTSGCILGRCVPGFTETSPMSLKPLWLKRVRRPPSWAGSLRVTDCEGPERL